MEWVLLGNILFGVFLNAIGVFSVGLFGLCVFVSFFEFSVCFFLLDPA
jgi:hypothetical protein